MNKRLRQLRINSLALNLKALLKEEQATIKGVNPRYTLEEIEEAKRLIAHSRKKSL